MKQSVYNDDLDYESIKITKIYVSGKISGEDIHASKKKFREACALIRNLRTINLRLMTSHGYRIETVNPHELPDYHAKNWWDYMRVCIIALCNSNEVYVLDCWKKSTGALVEVLIAKLLHKPISEVATMEALKVSYGYLLFKLFFRL